MNEIFGVDLEQRYGQMARKPELNTPKNSEDMDPAESMILNRIEIEDEVGRYNNGDKFKHFHDIHTYGLKSRGWDRAMNMLEASILIMNYFEDNLEHGMRVIAKDILKGSYEFLSDAVRRSGDYISIYFNVSNLRWDTIRNKYFAIQTPWYDKMESLTIKGLPVGSKNIRYYNEISPSFVRNITGRKYQDMPDAMKGEMGFNLFLRDDNKIWPLSIGSTLNGIELHANNGQYASRGIKTR